MAYRDFCVQYMAFLFLFLYFLFLVPGASPSNAASCPAGLVFSANLEGNWDLFMVSENGKDLVRFTNTPFDEKEPCWSKDRTKIAYAASDGKIYVINTAEGAKSSLETKHKISGFSPCFSPEGTRLVFVQPVPEAKDDTDLVLFDFNRKQSSTLIHQYAAQFGPSWSPDGRWIAYINSHCSGDCGRIIQELWLADPRGSHARQLLLTNSFCREPSWSPDGKRIAFSSDKAGNFDIWILNLEDWRLSQVTTFDGLDVSPAWSPDGKRLAFISTRSGIMEIWIKDLTSGESTVLRPFGRPIECKDVAW